MESEMLRIFNSQGDPIGEKTRSVVHQQGYWHETFHCWLIGLQDDTYYIDVQFRSPSKKDFPSTFDITAAGHILSHESKEEGVRELHEEIGIDAAFDELISLGTIRDKLQSDTIIDHELCHLYLYTKLPVHVTDYRVQAEEVGGMFRMRWVDFKSILLDHTSTTIAKGFLLNDDQTTEYVSLPVTKQDLTPHSDTYFQSFIHAVEDHFGLS